MVHPGDRVSSARGIGHDPRITQIEQNSKPQGTDCDCYQCHFVGVGCNQGTKPFCRSPRRGVTFYEISGQGRDRTGDTRIFSPVLYQLSYLANTMPRNRSSVDTMGREE